MSTQPSAKIKTKSDALTSVQSHFTGPNFRTTIIARHHQLLADEATEFGGTDAGFDPFELVLAGLAACTTATLKLYADRKGWPVADIDTHVTLDTTDRARPLFQVAVSMDGPLNSDQHERLLFIAEKCPVHNLLMANSTIETTLVATN